MKTLIALLVFALTCTCYGTTASTPREAAAKFYRYSQEKDVERLALMLHPSSLRGHRAFLEIALMKLEKTYGEEAVWTVVGLSREDMAALSDIDFFRQTMKNALELSELDAKPSRSTPKIIGEITDGPLVYVLSTQEHSIEESGKRFSMRSPQSLSFKKNGDAWMVFSFPFASRIAHLYAVELAAASKALK